MPSIRSVCCAMGGEDREAPDPFRVRLQFGWLDWVRMVVLGVTLAPLRFLAVLICLVLAWAIASVGRAQ